jgi:two-component sensor histidine kinase
MRETHHRIKNNLQIVSSLLNLQADKFKDRDVKEAFRESENRVASMSIIHEELYKSENIASIDFTAYLKKLTADLLSSYRVGDKKIQLFLDIDNTFLGIDTAIPLGIIINELFSNSLKYAFPKGEGEIRISLHKLPAQNLDSEDSTGKEMQKESQRYRLIYSDNGARFPKDVDFRNSETLGLQLINALVDQIGGTIEIETEKETKFILGFEEKKLLEQE